jgi:hypothetical protein
MQPPRIVNRTVPKIIAISVHTVNRFPFNKYISHYNTELKKHGSAHVDQHGLQGIVTVSYKTYRDTYQISR